MKRGNNGKLFTDINDSLFNCISGGVFMAVEYILILGFVFIGFLAWLAITGTNEIIEHKNNQCIIDRLIERKRDERL